MILLRMAYNFVDADKDGKLSKEEIKDLINKLKLLVKGRE
jgi:Ca2+-binding EF-hand superfamily protein